MSGIKTASKWRKRCKKWDWNYDLASIAKELIEEGVKPDSHEFEVLEKVFNHYFGEQNTIVKIESPKTKPMISQIEAIRNILEVFGEGWVTHR